MGTAILLSSKKQLIVIGRNDGKKSLSTNEIYDISSQTWNFISDMLSPRTGHTTTLLLSKQVFVTGGMNNEDYLSTCELYDPLSNTWKMGSNMSSSRVYHTASLLSSGKVLVAGGSTLPLGEIYDPPSIRGLLFSIQVRG